MKVDVKKLIILNIPYVIVFYMVDKVAWLYRHVNGDLAGMRLVNTFTNFKLAFQNPLPSFHPTDILIGIAGAGSAPLAAAKQAAHGTLGSSPRCSGARPLSRSLRLRSRRLHGDTRRNASSPGYPISSPPRIISRKNS